MLTNNTYFENLKRIGHEYEAARVSTRPPASSVRPASSRSLTPSAGTAKS